MKDQITQATSIDEIAALFLTYTENTDGTISKSGILYDWPKLKE